MRSTRINFSAAVFAAVLLAGCASNFNDSLSGNTADRNGESPAAPPADSAEVSSRSAGRLQQEVMDFSDRFSNDLTHAVDAYIAAEPEVPKQVSAQRLKLALLTSSMAIAASLDPRANLLDMAVFISAGKWAADRYWVPERLGEKGAAVREVYERADREIWEEVDRILTPAQRDDLHALINEWKKTADPREVVNVRLRNLDGVVLSRFQESASAKGLLASVKRLLGKVDQSLLYGERMMFYVERTPLILSQQADLTVNRVAERFPIATVNPDFDQWVDLANGLPKQIGDIFQQREQIVREALPEVRASLESLERITLSVQGTIASADSLAAKAERLPFAKEDYAVALERTGASLEKLNAVVEGLNRLLDEDASGRGEPRLNQLARLLDERAERAMDAVFLRLAGLIGLLVTGLLLVLVVARGLFRRPPASRS